MKQKQPCYFQLTTVFQLATAAIALVGLLLYAAGVQAVTAVNPSGVNVNHRGVTSVFLTFQNLGPNERPVEAFWCGEVTTTGVSAFNPCVQGTLFGNLPERNNLAQTSGTLGARNLTDIMTIPASVARRALQAAQQGANGEFFYVRRFSDGISDTYVTVTCRMAGGGARSPLAITQARVQFDTAAGLRPVYFVGRDEVPPPIVAEIHYNGTGRLKGRWEVVLPGDPEPRDIDLVTEATLPVEQRASQRRYTVLSRFDVFLPPTGEIHLPGPKRDTLPRDADGPYKILLRIEASAEKEGNSDTLVGTAISGGVAGFPMPVLRYFVGTPESREGFQSYSAGKTVTLIMPTVQARVNGREALTFSWHPATGAELYELQIKAENDAILSAVVKNGVYQYTAPPWLAQEAGTELRWRVRALAGGEAVATSEWRSFVIEPPAP